jgi:hypothetical protein
MASSDRHGWGRLIRSWALLVRLDRLHKRHSMDRPDAFGPLHRFRNLCSVFAAFELYYRCVPHVTGGILQVRDTLWLL